MVVWLIRLTCAGSRQKDSQQVCMLAECFRLLVCFFVYWLHRDCFDEGTFAEAAEAILVCVKVDLDCVWHMAALGCFLDI